MDKLVGIVTGGGKTRGFNDDDFSDRLSSQHTVVMLSVFAVLISLNQYVRNPITCWSPNHFSGGHVKYASNYCWVKNTYYIPWENDAPKGDGDDEVKRQMIPYYQWIPFILLGQAILFYLPSTIWHTMNSRAGVDADNILSAAQTFARTDKVETRERTKKMLTQQMNRFLSSKEVKNEDSSCSCKLHNCQTTHCCSIGGKRFGNYLVAIFLTSKILYILNVVGQLFLLNIVLSTKFSTFGFDMAQKILSSTDWTQESYVAFPRVTLCDFWIRGQDMSNAHRYTLQCVLPVNLYNEKIYLLLWYWMLFVAAISTCSFFVWLLRVIISSDRRRFVQNHVISGIKSTAYYAKSDENVKSMSIPIPDHMEIDSDLTNHINNFTDNFLRQDGALLLRLIAHNTDHVTTSDITHSLYDLWQNENNYVEDES